VRMNRSAGVLLLMLIIFPFLSSSAAFAADCYTPGSSTACVIRPWPDMDSNKSKEALDKWNNANTLLLSNGDGLTLLPFVTIPGVLDYAYRCAGAVEIYTHGCESGHSIEIYPYTQGGEDARDAAYDEYYNNYGYGNLIWKDFKENEGYFIAIRYSQLPTWVNSQTGTMVNAIFHNQCCYGEDGWGAFSSCGVDAFYGPSGTVTSTDSESNIETLWGNLGMNWDDRQWDDQYKTGTAYDNCPHLCFHKVEGAGEMVLGPGVSECSQDPYTEVPTEGLEVQITLDTDVQTNLCVASDAVDVSGSLTLESASWVGTDAIKAEVSPGTGNGDEGGELIFRADCIVSYNCPSLLMNGGENYIIELNSDGDYAATAHGFYVEDAVAHWRVTSEYKTAGYRIDGAETGKGPWNEIVAVEAGVGNRRADVSSSGFEAFRLVEIEESGDEIVCDIVKAGRNEVPSEDGILFSPEMEQKLSELSAEREKHGRPENKSVSIGEGETYVIFTVDSLADEVDTYVADYWETFGYTVYLRTVDAYPSDPDSFRVALKDSITDYATDGAGYFHLIGDANDWKRFSSAWPDDWEQIRQDYLAVGYPSGGQPEKDLIPTWSFPDTLPRLQNTSYFTPYILSDCPYSDIDDDGIPDVVLTRWPVTTEEEVLSMASKMQSYMDYGWAASSCYSILTCVGDVDHMDEGDGEYASRVADTVMSAVPAGQDTAYIYESGYIFGGDRNDAVSALWNNVDPELVLISSSYSNRSRPGNFFTRVGTCNPFHMGMLEEGFPAVVFGFTCDTGDFARTEDPYYGKPVFHRFLVENNKGAIAWIGPSLGSWERGNKVIGKYFVQELFSDLDRPVAQSFLIAQQRVLQEFGDDEGLQNTVEMYTFLGHPLLRLYSKPIITDVEDNEVPGRSCLSQNYPNPFNPVTTIRFSLARKGHVKLCIYDVRGRKVKTLLDRKLGIGTHTVSWDGRNERKEAVASGVYFYRLDARDRTVSRKMVLLK
ncbi:MAG: T9SS type A sorting domain-containing protein, partial [Candidatus Latescibacteria bacterium]|nr:T9SS type A sorting domain-containing protein [Candidatus Latescibacterota bacterium]